MAEDDDSKTTKRSILDKFRYTGDNSAIDVNFKVHKLSPSKKKRKKPNSNDITAIVDTSSYKDLQPSIDPNVKLVFVGFNPGLQSSIQQHHYAHFTNLFWKLFNQSKILLSVLGPDLINNLNLLFENDPILKRLVSVKTQPEKEYMTYATPADDFDLIKYGIGFTDLVLRCTKTAQELSKLEKLNNVPRLIKEFSENKPEFIVIVGKGIWECIVDWLRINLGLKFKLDKSFKWGRQSSSDQINRDYTKILNRWRELLGYDCKLYVFPNTSGLVTSLRNDEKLLLWSKLLNDILEV